MKKGGVGEQGGAHEVETLHQYTSTGAEGDKSRVAPFSSMLRLLTGSGLNKCAKSLNVKCQADDRVHVLRSLLSVRSALLTVKTCITVQPERNL